jgi:hypothetical protein
MVVWGQVVGGEIGPWGFGRRRGRKNCGTEVEISKRFHSLLNRSGKAGRWGRQNLGNPRLIAGRQYIDPIIHMEGVQSYNTYQQTQHHLQHRQQHQNIPE